MIGLLKGMATTIGTLFRKSVTVQYPDQRIPLSPRFRGAPGLLWDDAAEQPKCTGCGLCARSCPVSAIAVTAKENPRFAEGRSKNRRIVDSYTLDLGLCIFCSTCAEVCPFDALTMTKVFELASRDSASLIKNLDDVLELGRREQDGIGAAGGPAATAAAAAEPVKA